MMNLEKNEENIQNVNVLNYDIAHRFMNYLKTQVLFLKPCDFFPL